VTAIKSLWVAVQGDPTLMRRVNGWLTLFWVAMIPVSLVAGWLSSVVYVSALSLWALVSGHWSTWQAARVEVNQQRPEEKAASTELPTEVVDQVIARTGLPTALPVRTDRPESVGWPGAAPFSGDMAAARELVTTRCGVEAEGALTYLTNYAILSDLTLDRAARELLGEATGALCDPQPT
jgi:hypothetical protein